MLGLRHSILVDEDEQHRARRQLRASLLREYLVRALCLASVVIADRAVDGCLHNDREASALAHHSQLQAAGQRRRDSGVV